jgi:rubrerythrin
MMAKQPNLKDILDLAVLKEIEAQELYADLSRKSKSGAVREAFQALIQQEKQHQTLLGKYRAGELKQGALRMEHPCDYRIAEHFAGPKPAAGMELKDAFLFAADREKASHDFYLKLAHMHVAGDVRILLEKLASQELEHKAVVESLFTEVAFPQTDGG